MRMIAVFLVLLLAGGQAAFGQETKNQADNKGYLEPVYDPLAEPVQKENDSANLDDYEAETKSQPEPKKQSSKPTGINSLLSRLVMVETTKDGGVHVKAPFINLNTDDENIKLTAPLVNLNLKNKGVKVKAPFVDVSTKDGTVDVNAPFVHVTH